jgi:hypothetical protein
MSAISQESQMNAIGRAIRTHNASALRDIAERLPGEKDETARWLRLLADMFEAHNPSTRAYEESGEVKTPERP